MSARPTHDLVIKIGEYPDRETGEMKARWLTIGTVFKHDDGGTSIKLDCVPVGLPDWQGWVSVFPRRQPPPQDFQAPPGYQPRRSGNGRSHGRHNGSGSTPPPPVQDFDDDIPF